MTETPGVGFVYLATNKSMPGLVKIGMTTGTVAERMAELSRDTGVPSPFECAYFCQVQNLAAVERQLHEQFGFCRESGNREFFRIDWRAVKAAMQMMTKADGKLLSDSDDGNKLAKVSKFALVKFVKEENIDAVRQVLAAGGKPDQRDEDRMTALMWAALAANTEIVKILLEEGANPNLMDNRGSTALKCTADADVIDMLLNAGANFNQQGKNGWTALHCAATGIRAESAQALVDAMAKDAMAEIDVKDKYGWTPLYVAASLGQIKVAKIFIDAGADVNAESKNGITPIELAREKGHREMVELLRKHGAIG